MPFLFFFFGVFGERNIDGNERITESQNAYSLYHTYPPLCSILFLVCSYLRVLSFTYPAFVS